MIPVALKIAMDKIIEDRHQQFFIGLMKHFDKTHETQVAGRFECHEDDETITYDFVRSDSNS